MSEQRETQASELGAQAPTLLETLQFMSTEATALGKELFALVGSELALAAKSLPKLVATGIAALFFGVMSWLSVCAALSYVMYAMTGWGWLAFVSFAVFQLGALYACKVFITRYAHYLSLPYSRQFINDIKRGPDEPSNEAA